MDAEKSFWSDDSQYQIVWVFLHWTGDTVDSMKQRIYSYMINYGASKWNTMQKAFCVFDHRCIRPRTSALAFCQWDTLRTGWVSPTSNASANP